MVELIGHETDDSVIPGWRKLLSNLLDQAQAQDSKVLPNEAVELLKKGWGSLQGGGEEKMHGGKLNPERIENPVWKKPVLRFQLERHGRTVMGSTRAGVHTWDVDLEKGTATITDLTHRQLRPMDSRYHPRKDCEEVVKLISENADHHYLKWSADRIRVTVRLGEIVPGGYKQTEASRRKRFKKLLGELLRPRGWILAPGTHLHTYMRSEAAHSGESDP